MNEMTKYVIIVIVLALTAVIWILPAALYAWLFAPKWYEREPWNWQ